MFYKTQRELAGVINQLVDSYWNNDIDEVNFVEKVKELYANNSSKIVKMGDFTTIMKQQCGKRRLEVISKVIVLD